MCPIDFRTYGDTSRIPMYVWNVLISCLNECLTNVARHSRAETVKVTLDATHHIVRLCVENDGALEAQHGVDGIGLSNLRNRAKAIGGNLSVDAGDVFRAVCVIPIKTRPEEAGRHEVPFSQSENAEEENRDESVNC